MDSRRKAIRSQFAVFLFISAFIFLIIIGLRTIGSLESLELVAYDWFIRLRPEISRGAPRIVIITISEQDIIRQGRWPLTDAVLADALSILGRSHPRAIGFDIFRDISVPPGSEKLDSILSRNRRIIGVMKFSEHGVSAPPVLRNTEQVGFNDIIVDSGGIVRRALLFMDDGEKNYYSFALRLALLYLQKEGIVPQPDLYNPKHIKLGTTAIPPFQKNDGGYVQADDRGYQFLINFENSSEAFPSFSFTDVLGGEIDPGAIKDKIVLIGVKAQSVKDLFYTPKSRGFQIDQQTTGVEIHAIIANELLRFALDGSTPIFVASENLEIFWIFLWCLMGGGIGLWVRSPWRFSMWGIGGLLILGLTAYCIFLYRCWIPIVPPAMAWIISTTVVTAYISSQERRQRAILMQLFSRHVSPEVAEVIWRQREQFFDSNRPLPQKSVVTVFFSDLRGFSSVAESMDPKSLIDWLNTYMEPVAQLVMKYGGVIDDYAGDGIKANFGVPLPRKNEAEIKQDALNAINCALAMEKEMERLNILWQEQNLPPAGIRIGIYTGPAVAGVVGTSQRLKYTTVGDTVNIASRLESYDKNLAKDSPCRILIGESTLRYLDKQFRTEYIGQVNLKGKDKKTTIYRVLGKSHNSLWDESREVKK